MRTVIISALLLSACGGASPALPEVSGNLAGTPGLAPVTSTPPTAAPVTPIAGTYRLQGSFCGPAFTATNHVEDHTYAAGELRIYLGTICGTLAVQYYTTSNTASDLTTRLVKTWQPSQTNPTCPGVVGNVPNAATNTAGFQIVGSTLTVGSGTCAGGQVASKVYVKL